jgi:hypothetical protein
MGNYIVHSYDRIESKLTSVASGKYESWCYVDPEGACNKCLGRKLFFTVPKCARESDIAQAQSHVRKKRTSAQNHNKMELARATSASIALSQFLPKWHDK